MQEAPLETENRAMEAFKAFHQYLHGVLMLGEPIEGPLQQVIPPSAGECPELISATNLSR